MSIQKQKLALWTLWRMAILFDAHDVAMKAARDYDTLVRSEENA